MDKPVKPNEYLLSKLKIKPVAKEQVQVVVKIPTKEVQVIVKTTIVDKRKEGKVDRKKILQKMNEKFAISTKIPEPTQAPEPEPTAITPVVKKAKKKLKKIKLKPVSEEKDKPSTPAKSKRLTVKPAAIVREGPITMLKIGDTNLNKRLTKKGPNVLIKASSYYLNSREIFVNFISSLFDSYKQEILSDESTINCAESDDREFSLLTHQKIVRDYLNLYTPYRGLLLYHGLGSGKTCSSIAIAEGMKTHKQIIVMTPASLRMNYIEELKKCGEHIYKKNQFWEFINTRVKPELIDVLSNILSLSVDYITKNGGAWLVNVKKPSNFESLSAVQQTSLNNQINEMIRFKYQFINYNGLRQSHLQSLSSDYTKNPFDNKVVIIDEAHNFVSKIVNKLNRPDSLSMRLYEYIMNADNARIVFLSGTPIINYPNEIAVLYNMLRGKIDTWYFKLSINKTKKVSLDTFKKIFKKSELLDYIEYKPTSTTLVVTRNPFGFINVNKKGVYEGVKVGERGEVSNEGFVKIITSILDKHNITIIPSGTRVEKYKPLPDDLETFKANFIDMHDNDVKNMNMFKRRIIGLTSYFRSAQEQLMPRYEKSMNFYVIEINMSDYQLRHYEEARIEERKKIAKKAQKRKMGKEDDIYDTAAAYRTWSRALCNFVFPSPAISRPMPHKDGDVEGVIDEDALDGVPIEDRIKNPDGRYSAEDIDKLNELVDQEADSSYAQRQINALQKLKEHADKYLTPEALQIYSPKFLNILENILDSSHEGLHLVYSFWRTLEGIGIFKLILEANGFVEFKIKKSDSGVWLLNIPEDQRGKPTFALYTGTETPEEKEIIRNIFNSTWKYVPSSLVDVLKPRSSNNLYGEIIKVLMITASGAEGINLRNVRYVHITEPYWHPVRIEQVIGRARRICSHIDLPEALQTIDVFLYLMKFSDEQLRTKISPELRIKDLSKIDNKSIVTSDQAIYELATIKENINSKILDAVKEASIDCSLHSRVGDKEQLNCLSFAGANEDKFAYKPSYSDEDADAVADVNKKVIKWKAKKINLQGIDYAYKKIDDVNGEVYDLESYYLGNPVLIGNLEMANKKWKFKKI